MISFEFVIVEKFVFVLEKVYIVKIMFFSSISMFWDIWLKSFLVVLFLLNFFLIVVFVLIGWKFNSFFLWFLRSLIKVEIFVLLVFFLRRNMVSLVVIMMSNLEMMLSKLDEDDEIRVIGLRNSLKDWFKVLWMREEVGIFGMNGDEEK